MFAQIDMEATFAALLGQPLDPGARELNALPCCSANRTIILFAPIWSCTTAEHRAHLPCAREIGNSFKPAAVPYGRNDIYNGIKDLTAGPLLFDLSHDMEENQNLAAQHPEKIAELRRCSNRCKRRNGQIRFRACSGWLCGWQ